MIIYNDLSRLNKPINNLATEWIHRCAMSAEFREKTPLFVDYVKEKYGIDCAGFYVKETGNITLTRCGVIDCQKFIDFLLRYE
jgi:hypothetical protein